MSCLLEGLRSSLNLVCSKPKFSFPHLINWQLHFPLIHIKNTGDSYLATNSISFVLNYMLNLTSSCNLSLLPLWFHHLFSLGSWQWPPQTGPPSSILDLLSSILHIVAKTVFLYYILVHVSLWLNPTKNFSLWVRVKVLNMTLHNLVSLTSLTIFPTILSYQLHCRHNGLHAGS